MTRTIYCIAGMPRAGGVRLANLLGQNPRFDASAPPGMLAILMTVRDNWDALFAATPNERAKLNVMGGVLRSFHDHASRPVIFDRSPAWLAHLETLELLTRCKAKVLVPVRDVRDVLASFELLARRSAATTSPPASGQPFLTDMPSVASRCETWARPDQPVGLAYTRIEDALARGLRDRMHFVRFDDLVARPRETLRNVYDFLGERFFEHDFDRIEPVTGEEDEARELLGADAAGAHRDGVKSLFPHVSGNVAEKYKGIYAWDQPQWK